MQPETTRDQHGRPLGVSSLRLTGGEPLLHSGLEALERARALKAAGLDRLTLSLDGASGVSVARMAGLAMEHPRTRQVRQAALHWNHGDPHPQLQRSIDHPQGLA